MLSTKTVRDGQEIYCTGSPDPINVRLNFDLGRFFFQILKDVDDLNIFPGGSPEKEYCTSSSVYKLTLHWRGHVQGCKQVKYVDLCESERCPEQPLNPTSPAAHPSSVFCDDLLQHIKIWRVRFRFTPRWDELSLLFLGLWPVVNSPLLSPWLNFCIGTTRQHCFGY